MLSNIKKIEVIVSRIMTFICSRLLFCLAIISIYACQPKISEENQSSNAELLSVIDSIHIDLDSLTAKNWHLIQNYKHSNSDYLVFHDVISSDPDYIIFFDLQKRKTAFKIKLEGKGPNGIGKLNGFYVHSLDSIFVLSSYSYSLFLTDTTGTIKNRYKLIKSEINDDSAMPFVQTKAPMFIKNDTLYIPAIPDTEPFFTNYEKSNLLIALNLKTSVFKYKIRFPDVYKPNYWIYDHTMSSFAYNPNANKFVVSYPIDPKVYVYSQDSIQRKEVRSDFINNDISLSPLPKYTEDREELLTFQFSTDKFEAVYYDPYRNLYYRVCRKKYDERSIKKMINGESGKPPLSTIIVFNEKFEKLGEQTFENGIYSLYHFVITEKGIMLRKNGKSEDAVSYYLFQVKA